MAIVLTEHGRLSTMGLSGRSLLATESFCSSPGISGKANRRWNGAESGPRFTIGSLRRVTHHLSLRYEALTVATAEAEACT